MNYLRLSDHRTGEKRPRNEMSNELVTAGLALDKNSGARRQEWMSMSDFNSESRFGILTKNYTRDFRWIFDQTRIEILDFFVSALWCNWIFFCFRRFASTIVTLTSFLGESVPDGGK